MPGGDVIRALSLCCGYERKALVRDLTLSVGTGETIALLGPSGCGKTTLLRVLAGLHPPLSGSVELFSAEPKKLFGTGRAQFLHQDPAPWEHLTVVDNVRLAFKLLHTPATPQAVGSAIERVGLAGNEHKYPKELSKGMRARVVLARIFARSPEVLFVDEPFASLDLLRRERLNRELHDLRSASNCTTVMVTHDIVEALRFASRALVFASDSDRLHEFPIPLKSEAIDPNALPVDYLALRDRILKVMQGQTASAA